MRITSLFPRGPDRVRSTRKFPTTSMSGPGLVALRAGWLVLALAAVVPALASFAYLMGLNSLDVLFKGGVFSADPQIASGLSEIGLQHETLLRTDLGFRAFSMILFAATAIVIFARKSNDWMTALASVALLSSGTAWFAPLAALPEDSTLSGVAAFIGNVPPFSARFGTTFAAAVLFSFLLLFPDGRLVPSWSRYLLPFVAACALMPLAPADSALDPGSWPAFARAAAAVVLSGGGLAAQLYRYHYVAGPIQKQQTKLVVSALAAIVSVPVLLFVFNPGLGSGFSGLAVVTPRAEAIYNMTLLVIFGAALTLLPISIAVSVLRYRLWDVDVLINRTLVYGALTGILGAAYFGMVAGIGAIVGRSYIIVAIATLSVSVAFQPLRRSLQNLIDRHFYRARYDAGQKMQEFTQRLRQEIDLDTLARELLSLVETTVRPSGVSLWVPSSLRGQGRVDDEVLRRIAFWVAGGPARVQGRDFNEVAIDPAGLEELMRAGGAIDLEKERLESETLRAFRDVRVKLAVPLISQGEVVGLLNLGTRLSDTDYSVQDHRLLNNLADHAAAAVRVALLVRERDAEVKAHERIANEMHVAQLIQRQFLPKQLPELQGWDVHAHYSPAREVGGDFYDFVGLPDGRLVIVAGDVTGKGVPAALVMATTRSLLRGEAPRLISPAAILERANEQLIADIPDQMFVTCLCALLDPRTGEMTVANAGHNLPYLRNGDMTRELRATGMPLGLMPQMTYQEYSTTLAPGDSFLLHSDGLAEARNDEGEMFGFPRMRTLIADCDDPNEFISCLLDALDEFTGAGAEQDDDITLVVLHRLASERLRLESSGFSPEPAVRPAT